MLKTEKFARLLQDGRLVRLLFPRVKHGSTDLVLDYGLTLQLTCQVRTSISFFISAKQDSNSSPTDGENIFPDYTFSTFFLDIARLERYLTGDRGWKLTITNVGRELESHNQLLIPLTEVESPTVKYRVNYPAYCGSNFWFDYVHVTYHTDYWNLDGTKAKLRLQCGF